AAKLRQGSGWREARGAIVVKRPIYVRSSAFICGSIFAFWFSMSDEQTPGGIIHTYQKYDPVNLPSPTAPPPDLVSPAFEHLLFYGDTRHLTPEQLANAVRIDPSQIANLGPSLDALMDILRERKRKILATDETGKAETEARQNFLNQAQGMRPPSNLAKRFEKAVREEQLSELEQLWYRAGNESDKFARQLLHLVERLGEKYQV